MPRRTKEEAEKTRTRVLASALSLFARKGYEHVTFTDIAARLKLTKGAVYWHFPTKEALLIALVDEMLKKFRRQLDERMPNNEALTYPLVAEIMVENAERLVEDPKGTAFFMLMKTKVEWGGESMAGVREQLLSNGTAGPYHAFIQAIRNDIAAGRVRADVNPVEIASVGIAIWDGLVRSRIEKFLACDLTKALRNSYRGIWEGIRVKG